MARRKRPQNSAPSSAPPSVDRRGRRIALASVVLVAIGALGALALWMRSTPPPLTSAPLKPNVVLITLDTTRADRIGAYGYAAAATPVLDRLAATGVRFDQAFSPAPLTLPAHASLMTARQPYGHGVRNNGYFTLSGDVPTLAALFTAAGYDTAAFVSAFVLDRQFGLARGFAHYDDALDHTAGPAESLELERRGDRTVAAAGEWLSTRTADRPYFLWVHLFDPHEPYAPPSPFREQFPGTPYDGEIAFIDRLVGQLLERTGYGRSPTLVVAAGDHGESLGEHGESTHGLFVYDAALRVPLIVAGAGITAPAIVTDPVRLIDIAPTIADLAGIGMPPGAEGRSLRPLMSGTTGGDDAPPVYAETYFPQFFMQWAPLQSLRVGRWKFIEAPEPELYDLSSDPGEHRNVIAREPERATSLRRALAATLAGHSNTLTPTPMSDDARRRLASLGYVSGAATPPRDEAAPGPDPKHMVEVFERLLDGNRALARGDAQRAARVASEVVGHDPANAFARLLQGRAALALGRNREAMAALAAYLAIVPQSADAHHLTALAALRLGDRQRALAEEEAALALDPRHASAIALRAGLLLSMDRGDEGIESLRAAVRRDPVNHMLAIELADLLVDARRFADAEAEYRRLLTAQPASGRAHAGLGLVFAATDRLQPALDSLTRALEVNSQDEEARLIRAEVLTRMGRTADAQSDYALLVRTATRPDIRDAAVKAIRSLRD